MKPCALFARRPARPLSPRRSPRLPALSTVLAVAWLAACGGDGGSLADPVAGTAVVFDLDADLGDPARFYDLPYPSDLRLDEAGRPMLDGFPFPRANGIIVPVWEAAARRRGFPAVGAAYFRFEAALAPRDPRAPIAASPDAPVLIVDVDPSSPERGRLFPAIADVLEEDPYTPAHVLVTAPFPGIVLSPNRLYAVVIRRSLGDATGAPLGVPEEVATLRGGGSPPGERGVAMRELLAPVWPTLDAIAVPRGDVAAVTAFTTGDVVAEMAELASAVAERHPVEIEGLAIDPDDGALHERFCELHGFVRFPQFQRGEPPFDQDGLFETGADGLPILQREEEAPVTITLPRTPMPSEGYPVAIYFHGSGGLSTQVVDRGRVDAAGGTPARGEGPAHVLAAHGLATVASALPLNPQRLADAGSREYLNFLNLGAYPDTFRQTTIEQRLLIDAVSRLRLDPAVVEGCAGPTPPAGESQLRLDVSRTVALGQSLGAQVVNMAGATDARIGAAVPTGSGGLWSLVVLEAELVSGIPLDGVVPALLGTTARVDSLHPGLQLVQTAFEPADPVVYAARLAQDPLPGHPTRSVFIAAGLDDPGFSNRIYAAMSLASGTEQAGDVLSPEFPEALSLGGLGGLAAYPAAENVVSAAGVPYTGVVAQYESDGILDSHHIFAQRDEVKHQYGCFFATYVAGGRAVVPAPAPLGTSCSE